MPALAERHAWPTIRSLDSGVISLPDRAPLAPAKTEPNASRWQVRSICVEVGFQAWLLVDKQLTTPLNSRRYLHLWQENNVKNDVGQRSFVGIAALGLSVKSALPVFVAQTSNPDKTLDTETN